MSSSRTSPVMRDANVRRETREADLNSDTGESVTRASGEVALGNHLWKQAYTLTFGSAPEFFNRAARAKIAGFAGNISKHRRN